MISSPGVSRSMSIEEGTRDKEKSSIKKENLKERGDRKQKKKRKQKTRCGRAGVVGVLRSR